jgi:arylsulfatase A-like enzyme
VTRGFEHVDTSALKYGKNNAPQVADAAIHILESPHDRPLYVWVHFFDAHPPYQPVPGVAYGKSDDRDHAYYDSELTYLDRELGRLIDAIDKRTDATYVFVTADHSTVFHPHPETRHFHYGYDLYTATLHVPLIVHGPGIAPGRAEGEVSTMDIYPTILDLVRAPDRGKQDGTSLLPEALAHQKDGDRVTFHEFYLPENLFRGLDPLEIVSAHDGRYNLVLNRKRGTYELYDSTQDYYEIHDVYEEHFRDRDVAHLRSLLGAFVQQFYKKMGIADRSRE